MDIETRRQKQQELMVRIVERKVRERAQQLYDERGQEDGRALQDWFQAELEVLESTTLAPLYRRMKSANQNQGDNTSSTDFSGPDSTAYQSPA